MGIWCFDFYLLPLGLGLALLAGLTKKYLGGQKDDEGDEEIKLYDDDGKRRSVVEDSQVLDQDKRAPAQLINGVEYKAPFASFHVSL